MTPVVHGCQKVRHAQHELLYPRVKKVLKNQACRIGVKMAYPLLIGGRPHKLWVPFMMSRLRKLLESPGLKLILLALGAGGDAHTCFA
jgi:hypothetical protein